MKDKRTIVKAFPLLKDYFERKPKIHPIIDYADGTFFYGVWLDSNVYYSETESEIRKFFWIFTKDGVFTREQILEKYDFKSPIPDFSPLFKSPSNRILNAIKEGKLNEIMESKDEFEFLPADMVREFLGEKDDSKEKLTPKEVFDEVKMIYEDYLDFQDEGTYYLMPCWVIGTYLHPIFATFPYIYVGGMKGTGKTKTLLLTKQMAFHGLMSASCSASSLFRIIDAFKPTLFIDESEPLSSSKNKPELTYILNSGYKKGTYALRSEKKGRDEKFSVITYDLYSPKMLASIRGLDNIMESRTISIIMRRTSKKQGEREIDENNPYWQEVRDKLFSLAFLHFNSIKEIYENMKNDSNLKNRDWELWKPILAIAKFISDEVYQKIIEFAEKSTEVRYEEEQRENMDSFLLSVLAKMIYEDRELTAKDILEEMKLYLEESETWVNAKWLGKAIKRLGFPVDKKHKRRTSTGMVYFFEKKDVDALVKAWKVEPIDVSDAVIDKEKQTEGCSGSPEVSTDSSPAVEYVDMTKKGGGEDGR